MPPDKSVNIFGGSVYMGAKDAGERMLTPSIRLQPSRIVCILSAIAVLLVCISVVGSSFDTLVDMTMPTDFFPLLSSCFTSIGSTISQPCFPCFSYSARPLYLG